MILSASSTATSTQIHLKERPTGWPTEENFSIEKVELPPLQDGEVRVHNSYISVDPYMRGRMIDAPSYIPPFKLGEVMDGGAVGTVVESSSEDLPVGTLVSHFQGWRDIAQGPAAEFRQVQSIPGIPDSAHLGVLGITCLLYTSPSPRD
mgnify:CR=1 FL=1